MKQVWSGLGSGREGAFFHCVFSVDSGTPSVEFITPRSSSRSRRLPPSGCSAPVVVSAQTVTPGRKQACLVKGLIRKVPQEKAELS